jgi:dTDP-4-dehydrorhamnose 3,5-epimerase
MNVIKTELPEVVLLEPRVFEDARGLAFESYNRRLFRELTGVDADFVQDNRSRSAKNVLRGLHYQVVKPQGKLISVLAGEIYDVAVDLRRGSPRFGKWAGFTLSAVDRRMAWIPPGFGHGFLALAEGTEVMYKLSDFWAPEHERVILWNDRRLGIRWPIKGEPILSPRDAKGAKLAEAEVYP